MIIIFPLYILPLVFLVLGLGFITSILQVIFKDTQYFINLGLSFFIFLMPIMYVFPQKKGPLSYINSYNPIYYLISVPRDLMIFGRSTDLAAFLISSIFSLVVFFVGWFIFYLSETKIAERM
jgi:ABC-type polysaccharide/polyol phosphate export permease